MKKGAFIRKDKWDLPKYKGHLSEVKRENYLQEGEGERVKVIGALFL